MTPLLNASFHENEVSTILETPLFVVSDVDRQIWNLKVPLKVKSFLWRACRGVLPTRVRINEKGLECPSLYVMCGENLETSFHCFLDCRIVRNCWVQSYLCHAVESLICTATNFAEWFFAVCRMLDMNKAV